MENAKPMKTPMYLSMEIGKYEKGKLVNEMVYKSMIRSLLYLTACRLDIMFSVESCARFQAHPKSSHHAIVKRTSRYFLFWFSTCILYYRQFCSRHSQAPNVNNL